MAYQMEFRFEEQEIEIDGGMVYASGSLDIEYFFSGPDECDFFITSASFSTLDWEKDKVSIFENLEQGHPMVEALASKLYRQIETACWEDQE